MNARERRVLLTCAAGLGLAAWIACACGGLAHPPDCYAKRGSAISVRDPDKTEDFDQLASLCDTSGDLTR